MTGITREMLDEIDKRVELERDCAHEDETTKAFNQEVRFNKLVESLKELSPKYKKELDLIEKLEQASNVIGFKIKQDIPLGTEYLEFNACIDKLCHK